MWARHLIMDLGGCDAQTLGNPERLLRFLRELVAELGVRPVGEPLVESLGEDLETEDDLGFCLIQRIETSVIVGHFLRAGGEAYLDVLCPEEFDTETVQRVVRRHLRPKSISKMVVQRQA